jgi:hypothetical protein
MRGETLAKRKTCTTTLRRGINLDRGKRKALQVYWLVMHNLILGEGERSLEP